MPATLLFLLAVLGSGVSAAPTGNNNGSCILEYQERLQELLSFKESCGQTNLKDCCQVANVAQMLGEASLTNVLYTINDVCATDFRRFKKTEELAPETVQARCDPQDGWLVIMRRKADAVPLVNFNRSWVEYENGFGDLNTEFWYGLKNMHCLTQRDDMEFMIELNLDNGTGITWTYQTFRVDGPETNYVLHIGGAERVRGSGVDGMVRHNGYQFTTFDQDNDEYFENCALYSGAGWWYTDFCFHVRSNAVLTLDHTLSGLYLLWNNLYYPHVEMKIRQKTCLYKQSKSCD